MRLLHTKNQGLPLLLWRHVRKETATFYDPVMLVAEPVSWCQHCSALFLDHDEPQSGAFRCLAWSSSRAGTEELQKPFSSNQQVLWKFRCPQSFRSCMGMKALLRTFWIMAGQDVHMNSGSPPVSPSLDVPEGYLRPAIKEQILFFSLALSHPDKNSTENDFTKQQYNCIRGPDSTLIYSRDKEVERQQCYVTTHRLCMCMDIINENSCIPAAKQFWIKQSWGSLAPKGMI